MGLEKCIFLLIYCTIYAEVGRWVGPKKAKNMLKLHINGPWALLFYDCPNVIIYICFMFVFCIFNQIYYVIVCYQYLLSKDFSDPTVETGPLRRQRVKVLRILKGILKGL